MKIYNGYVLTVALFLLLTTVTLTAVGQSSLDLYYTVMFIGALIITELYVHLNRKARRGLNRVGAVLFAGLLVVVAVKVIEILV